MIRFVTWAVLLAGAAFYGPLLVVYVVFAGGGTMFLVLLPFFADVNSHLQDLCGAPVQSWMDEDYKSDKVWILTAILTLLLPPSLRRRLPVPRRLRFPCGRWIGALSHAGFLEERSQ